MQPRPAGPQLPSIRTLHPYLPAIGPGPSTSTSTYEPAQMSTQSHGAGLHPPSSYAGSNGKWGVTGENEPPKKRRCRQVLSCTEPHPAGPQLPSIRTLHPYLPAIGPGPSTSTSTYELAQMSTQSQGAGVYPPSSYAGSDGDERGVTGENEPPKKRCRRQVLSCPECKRRKIRTQPCGPCVRRGDQAKCHFHVVEHAAEKYVPRAEHDALCARVDALEVWTKQVFAAQPLPSGVHTHSHERVTASPAHTRAQALGGGDEGGGSAVQWGEGFRSFPAAGTSSSVGAGGGSNAGTSPTHPPVFGITTTSGGGGSFSSFPAHPYISTFT
ncbi:hypothetical protein B0H11DRAFT_2399095 [Mycena galericulata]|nr:hypothetical protein B0H11DRAFT_2399095 [Mycena galericulata]